jgi:hypothetical protein
VHNEFIDEIAATYDFASTVSAGMSYEGRDMRVLVLNKAGPGARTVYIEAGLRICHLLKDRCNQCWDVSMVVSISQRNA